MANGRLRAAALIATLGLVAGGLVLALERSSSQSAASASCSRRSTSFHCLLRDQIDPAAASRNRPRPADGHRYVSARISRGPGCDLPGSSEYFDPSTNIWWAGRGAGMVTVCAGGDAGQQVKGQIRGRLMIIRSGLEGPASFKADGADVPSAGVLRIVGAPEGRHLPARVETQANIRFRDPRGVRGTLHLRDDSVTLEAP